MRLDKLMAKPADSDIQQVGIEDQFTLCTQTIANIEKFRIDIPFTYDVCLPWPDLLTRKPRTCQVTYGVTHQAAPSHPVKDMQTADLQELVS